MACDTLKDPEPKSIVRKVVAFEIPFDASGLEDIVLVNARYLTHNFSKLLALFSVPIIYAINHAMCDS